MAKAIRTPLWLSIAKTLRSAIAEGAYAPGSKLPTEAALAERFGVNRHTVRHAIAHLVQDGLVHTRRGSGAFILAKPLDYPLRDRMRFHQTLLAAGRMPESAVLSVEVLSASALDAERLSVRQGDPIVISHALSLADGTPVALTERRFPEGRLPGLADALREVAGVTRALERVGVTDYVRVSTRLTASTATATQALHLRVPEGAPLLVAEALSQDTSGQPVEHGLTWFASDRITLTLDHSEL